MTADMRPGMTGDTLRQRQSQLTLALADARHLGALADTLFAQLAAEWPVHQGCLYVNPQAVPGLQTLGDDASPVLRHVASYASAGAPETVVWGEGLVGQCAEDRRTRVYRQVPPGFWRVATAGGETSPGVLLLVPIQHQGALLGVLELASLSPALEQARADIESLLPVIALNLEALLTEQRMQEALDAARTHARRAQEQVERSEAVEHWYQAVLYAAPDALLVVDEQGHIVLSNRAAQELLGYSSEALQDMPVEELVPHMARAAHADLRERYHHDPEMAQWVKGWRSGVEALHRDGTHLPVEISLATVPAGELRGPCVCVVLRPMQRGIPPTHRRTP